jgi:hypothetical protein
MRGAPEIKNLKHRRLVAFNGERCGGMKQGRMSLVRLAIQANRK